MPSLTSAKRVLPAATRRQIILSGLAGLAPSWALSQGGYPNRPVRIVVPYAPGGTADTLGRLAAKHLGDALKQSFIIDNKAGAGGVIGSKEVARAAPDGYTLVVSGIGSHVIAPVENTNSFDPMKDFTHIALLGGPPVGFVVNSSLPVKDFKEFVAYAKASKEGVSWGSSGTGTHAHLTGELLRQATGLNMVHIGYKGGSPAANDVVANQIPAALTALSSTNAHVDSGKLRLLAVSASKRVAAYPNVPTFAELGYPQLTGTTWFSISGPAGMPKEIVDLLNAEIRRGLRTPAAAQAMARESIEAQDLDARAFTNFVAAEIARWQPAVRGLRK